MKRLNYQKALNLVNEELGFDIRESVAKQELVSCRAAFAILLHEKDPKYFNEVEVARVIKRDRTMIYYYIKSYKPSRTYHEFYNKIKRTIEENLDYLIDEVKEKKEYTKSEVISILESYGIKDYKL